MDLKPIILIVDDEIRSLEAIKRILYADFEVLVAESAEDAFPILDSQEVQVVLCDQKMPGMSGVEFFITLREKWPEIGRLLISGYTDAEDIVEGINKGGIHQYISKPWHPDNLKLIVGKTVKLCRLQKENQMLGMEMKLTEVGLKQKVEFQKKQLKQNFHLEKIVRTQASPINESCKQSKKIALHNVSVLICGESGTGKELFARAIHYNSPRADKPFVTENCGALPDELLSSELFGHKKGSFTGAINDHIGLFEKADGGTIFLDEIGEVTPLFQVKLLRVLQEGEIRPMGSNRTRSVDVRMVVSTNKDLEEEVRKGNFRQDLYYRLATVTLHLPALRERAMDIEVLANFILKENSIAFNKPARGFTREAIDIMEKYQWPGNVREMQNVIQHMLVFAKDEILGAELLPRKMHFSEQESEGPIPTGWISNNRGSLKERVESLESMILKEALIRHQWNKSKAALELGISRVGLRSKLERYGLKKLSENRRVMRSLK